MESESLRLGVVSDTHLPRFGRRLPGALLDGLRAAGVGLIVHLGDFTVDAAVGQLEAVAPLVAVAGNNDPPDLVRRFGRRRVLELGGHRLGLVHGDEGRGARTVDRAAASFATDHVDAVLFGHSHVPLVEWRDGTLLLNPGSPTDKRRQPLFSYALLEIRDGRLVPELVTYADRSPPREG